MPSKWSPLRRGVIRFLVAMLVLWAGLQAYTDWLCTAGARKVVAIGRAVRESKVLPSETEVQVDAGLWEDDLYVYGVSDSATQERVIDVVREATRRLATKPVSIEFRTSFRMRPTVSGSSVADRGELLRTEIVR